MSEIDLLRRRLERERAARKQAEDILESKALELYSANESLKKLNETLEDEIQLRTKDLQESESKYRNVIDAATDIIYSTDEEGYFTFINPRGSEAFGYSPSEILGKRYIDFVLEEHRQELFEYYTKFRDGGVSSDYFEFPIRSKDGQVHWIGQNVNRVESSQDGFYYNAVARDITPRKKAEKGLAIAQAALTQSEVKYRSVLENLDLGLMEVDTNGIIHRVYDRFCKMTGYSKDELLGRNAIDTLVTEEYKAVLEQQDSDRLKRKSAVYEVQLRRKDGKLIWVLISGAPFYNSDGEVIGSLGIHFDITDRKELEGNLKVAQQKAVQAQQAEQQFLANMSHEIRTPLNAIIGMSHLLGDTSLTDKQSEYVNILSDSAALLKGLVSDILDISKIDSGMAEKNETTFNLLHQVERLVKTFEPRALDKGIAINYTLPPEKTCLVHTDMQWLHQILINLISNAIKFTPAGSVQLMVTKVKEAALSSQYLFEVSDTGIGMNESEVANIFTSFKQANTKVRTEFGGTGLGLSIASRLVSLLGGELEVESIKGHGSRFFFSLNLASGSDSDLPITAQQVAQLSQQKDYKLLVVEDNEMNQKYISALLEKWKINFDLAENGQQAVERYQTKHYDLIFMDLSMPIMDGYQATNAIRSLPGDRIPIIALTASTFLSKKELALQSGMTDFLAKPFTPEELSMMLQKHLNKPNKQENQSATYQFSTHLDTKLLDSLYNGDLEHALDMFETYLHVVDAELTTLEQYLLNSDNRGIRRQIHKMKPMFSMVGLSEITTICESIQSAADQDNHLPKAVDEVLHLINSSKDLVVTEATRLQKHIKQSS